ncbi:hypothetical protein FBQ99_14870 [Chloroflexi bacterium CFX2]|nr:hypothetical protein [Chloroflexi bacterium CFX2]
MTRTKNIFRMNRKTERLLRRFQNRHNVRSEVVHLLASGQPVEDATPEEQVAVIAILCINQPFSEVVQRVSSHTLEGSTGNLGSQFFAVLEETVTDLEREGLDQTAADLLKVGEVLAEMHGLRELVARYREQRLKKVESRIRDLPFLKQRGR